MGVNHNVLGLVSELKNRCIRLIQILNSNNTFEDVNELREEAVERLKHTYAGLQDLERDQLLQHSKMQAQAISAYQELFQQVVLVEEILVPVLITYDNHDHRGFLWLHKFASETLFPTYGIPSITAKSDHYYWTYPDLGIVGMPIGDIEGILGWPDLVHELGHVLLAIRPNFVDEFIPLVKQHFQSERDLILDLGGHPQSNRWINIAQLKWGGRRDGTWREEIACDLIATYLVGPAYGWQHLRLVTNRDNDPYFPLPTSVNHTMSHPADQARFEAILGILLALKRFEDIKRLETAWKQMLEARYYGKRPQGFDVYYPRTLITQLANIVHQQCQHIGLIPFTEQQSQNELDIVSLIDHAWNVFRKTPSQYGQWEKTIVQRFWVNLEPAKSVQPE